MTKIQKSIGKLGAGMKAGLNDANRAVDGAIRGLRAFGAQAAKVGTVLGASLGAAAYKIVQTGADFEEAITAVGAVGLQTRDQIADLEQEALRLGATTSFTATQAANAMEIMARAGFSNQEILAGVGGVLSAAAASGLEMAEVADHVSNVLKGMGLQASEASRVADVLTLASARTNSSIGSLGESMKNLSPVAKQFGISLEDAVGMVALLQDVGLDASEAGTATATMLTKLAKPTTAVEKQMKKLGITFKDAQGNLLPPLDIFRQMAAANEKLGGNMDQVAFFADLVGLRGQKAALNLKDLFTSDKGQQLTDALRDAEGSAEAMAKLRMDNLKGDWGLFESAVDGVKVALFDLEGGPLRGVVQAMASWVSANQELIVSGVKDFIQDVRDILPDIVYWGEKIAIIAAVFGSVAAAIKIATVAAAAFNAIAAANPYVLIGMAIVAAIALVVAFWPEITAMFAQFWEDLKYIGGSIADWFVDTFSGIWESIKSVAVAAFEFIVGALSILFWPQIQMFKLLFGLVQKAADWVMQAWEPIKGFFASIWEGIKAGAEFVWGLILDGFTIYVDTLKAIWSPIIDFFAGLWESVKSTFMDVLGPVLDTISWAVDKVRGIGAGILGTGSSDGTEDGPQIVSPQERTARTISETNTISTAELFIRDQSGRAELKAPRGSPFNLVQQPSGAL